MDLNTDLPVPPKVFQTHCSLGPSHMRPFPPSCSSNGEPQGVCTLLYKGTASQMAAPRDGKQGSWPPEHWLPYLVLTLLTAQDSFWGEGTEAIQTGESRYVMRMTRTVVGLPITPGVRKAHTSQLILVDRWYIPCCPVPKTSSPSGSVLPAQCNLLCTLARNAEEWSKRAKLHVVIESVYSQAPGARQVLLDAE